MAKAFTAVFVALAVAAVMVDAQVGAPCSWNGRSGTCIEPARSACAGDFVSNKCLGATTRCCLAPIGPVTPVDPAAAPSCTDFVGNTGKCIPPSSCANTVVSGRCAGANKCCINSDPVLPSSLSGALGQTYFYNLRSASFPGRGYPDAAVYFPRAFNPNRGLNIVVFIHGWVNCVKNVLGAVNSACTSGTRASYDVIGQVERTGKNVLLIVPEIDRDKQSGSPGQLGAANGLKNLINEILGEKLASLLGGPKTVNDVSRIIVFGHSAAYQTTSAWATQGVAQLKEIHMLDSMYGAEASYRSWITAHKTQFANREYRFTNLYYSSTASQSIAQAKSIKAIVPAGVYLFEPNATPETAAQWATPVLFKASSLKDHDKIPRNFIEPLLSQSPI